MKNVLMISFFFLPFGGGWTIRTLNFVKYLPEFGWNPIVLTVEEECYDSDFPKDYESLNEISRNVKIIRTGMLKKIKRFNKDRVINDIKKVSGPFNLPNVIKNKFLSAFYPIGKSLILPDMMILWFPFVLRELRKIIRSSEIDALYVVGPPHSTCLIGAILKKITGLPTIIDMKDDWVTNPGFMSNKNSIAKSVEMKLERFTIKNADKVVIVTQRHLLDLEKRYNGKIGRDKFVLIPNGFDGKDFETKIKSTENLGDKFVIVHTGLLDKRRSPIGLFQALKSIQAEHEEISKEIKLLLIGSVDNEYNKQVKELQLENIVTFIGNVSHKKCIEYLRYSTIALVIPSADLAMCIPGKIYEYVGAGKSILALTKDDCAVTDLITQYNMGIIVSPDDTESIKKAILWYYKEFKKGELNFQPSEDVIKQYDRRYLTFKLSQVLDQLKITHIEKTSNKC
jgi:glycosyltransferase involved in cell wall biosynthesis